jgi:hypothetical protein
MKRIARRLLGLLALLVALAAVPLLYLDPLFAHAARFGAFDIRSDRPIDPAMASVVADAERRLRTSDLFRPDDRFRVYICNDPWRLLLFARSTKIGGSAEAITRRIYLREADIPANRLIGPDGAIADADVRPLSYFIAHEAAHVLESRRFGRLALLRAPKWLSDGLADRIGKGGDFDIAENRARLLSGDPELSAERARVGLYRRYHLMVAALIEEQGRTPADLYAAPPTEAEALAAAMGKPRGAAPVTEGHQ